MMKLVSVAWDKSSLYNVECRCYCSSHEKGSKKWRLGWFHVLHSFFYHESIKWSKNLCCRFTIGMLLPWNTSNFRATPKIDIFFFCKVKDWYLKMSQMRNIGFFLYLITFLSFLHPILKIILEIGVLDV